MNLQIPYESLKTSNQSFTEQYLKDFNAFLEGGWYILGKGVLAFEEAFAEYCGSKYAVGLASGLDALVLALDGLYELDTLHDSRREERDEVIVPSNTYIATILAIVRSGLKPVLVEPNIRTYNIDVEKIEASITPKTKAILAVHLYGKSCQMDTLVSICEAYNLSLIEDVAQAHGAMYKGKKVGTFGIGCFSFYPTKNLGALGDAGAIITSDTEQDKTFRSLRNYGSSKKYHNDRIGYNSRLDELQAYFLLSKLKALNDIIAHKRKLAKLYLSLLKDEFIKPVVEEDYFDVYHIFNIRHLKRDELKAYLLENSIGTEIHYPVPPHKQKAMKGLIEGQYPISEEIHRTTLSLPISYAHSEEDIYRVIEVLNRY